MQLSIKSLKIAEAFDFYNVKKEPFHVVIPLGEGTAIVGISFQFKEGQFSNSYTKHPLAIIVKPLDSGYKKGKTFEISPNQEVFLPFIKLIESEQNNETDSVPKDYKGYYAFFKYSQRSPLWHISFVKNDKRAVIPSIGDRKFSEFSDIILLKKDKYFIDKIVKPVFYKDGKLPSNCVPRLLDDGRLVITQISRASI